MHIDTLNTERLCLRAWQDSDLAPFAELNADSQVMAYFPAPLTPAASAAQAAKIRQFMQQHGWGLWAVECSTVAPFIGFVGLNHVGDGLPIAPCVEIGWRLSAAHWGHGYATEAANAALAYAFQRLQLAEVVSFTAVLNRPSQRVMERIGMICDDETFEHPRVPVDHPLRTHVVYRLTAQRWQKQVC